MTVPSRPRSRGWTDKDIGNRGIVAALAPFVSTPALGHRRWLEPGVDWALHSWSDGAPSWNESYAAGELRWDTGEPEPLLVEFVTSSRVQPTLTLELLAGFGASQLSSIIS